MTVSVSRQVEYRFSVPEEMEEDVRAALQAGDIDRLEEMLIDMDFEEEIFYGDGIWEVDNEC